METIEKRRPKKELSIVNRLAVEPQKSNQSVPESVMPAENFHGNSLLKEGTDALLKGIVWAEVLGPPRCRRRGLR